MERDFSLAEAMNTYIPALLVLREKGFYVRLIPSDDDMDREGWSAEKGRRRFYASDPLCLLGLTAMWEQRGDDWQWRDGEPNLYDEIRSKAYAPPGGAI